MSKVAFYIVFLLLNTTLLSQESIWRTAMYAQDEFRYFLGTEEPPGDWTQVGFDDSSWPVGNGSIGYADGDDNTIIEKVPSIFMRYEFDISDLDEISKMVFHADYDDGFIAYLNGQEIARSNLEGVMTPFDQGTPAFREAQFYQGGLPEYFQVINFDSYAVEGKNVIAIQTHNYLGLTSSDLTTLYWLSLEFNQPSDKFGMVPDWFPYSIFYTHLPIIHVDTYGQEIEPEPEIEGIINIIYNGPFGVNSILDSLNDFSGPITIEKRGQTSLTQFPKNGYGIETKDEFGEDIDVSLLGFPEEEDWILHGPYSDKTLVRNILAMDLAERSGQYASRTQPIELYVNDQYEGVYVLMEKIKRNENRVDISKLKNTDISGDELTGGYIFKLDKGETDWFSRYDMINNPGQKLRFQYVYPRKENIQSEQEEYIQSYVDSFELAMQIPNSTFGGKRFDQYIDLPSFVDHFLVSEMTKNVDAYRISSYYYKDKDSKGGLIHAGPVWDFNLAFGNADYCNMNAYEGWVYDEHCGIFNPFWWGKLMNNARFANMAHCRWKELREGPYQWESIESFIDQQTSNLETPAERNFAHWPVLGELVWPNQVVWGESYEEEVAYLKDFVRERLKWMDNNMIGSYSTTSVDFVEPQQQKVFPNPVSKYLTLPDLKDGTLITLINSSESKFEKHIKGGNIDVSDLQAGLYIGIYNIDSTVIHFKFIKI